MSKVSYRLGVTTRRHKATAAPSVPTCYYRLRGNVPSQQFVQPPGQNLICAPLARKGEGHPFQIHSAQFAMGTCTFTCPPTLTRSFLKLHPDTDTARAILFHRRIGFLHPGHQPGRVLPASPLSALRPADALSHGELTSPKRARLTQAEQEVPSPLLLLVSSWPYFPPSHPHFNLCNWILTAVSRGPEHLSPRVPEAFWGNSIACMAASMSYPGWPVSQHALRETHYSYGLQPQLNLLGAFQEHQFQSSIKLRPSVPEEGRAVPRFPPTMPISAPETLEPS